MSSASAPALTPALTVLYHREPSRIGERALLGELLAGREVALSRTTPLFTPVGAPVGAAGEVGAPLGDPRLSRQPVRLLPGAAGGLRLIVDSGRGRVRYRGQEVKDGRDISAAELLDGGVLELSGAVALVLHLGQACESVTAAGLALLGGSHRMQAVRAEILRLADSEVPVLIRGETGTGKELAAQALHDCGRRAAQPFVAVNLGAVPASLAAAELFGAERGAYTGAANKQLGYFQQARAGTLFLDEIGEAPPEVQVLLLRAIETGEVRALGAGVPQKTQARVVAATDADLEALIAEKAFRRPLLHRLAGCELRLPALRERREDIGELVLHFLRLECAAAGRPFLLDRPDVETAPWLPLPLLVRLCAFDWPGNVRQLRNVVRQMILGSSGRHSLELPALFAEEKPQREAPAAKAEEKRSKEPLVRRRPAEIEEAELVAALERNRWDLTATAADLKIARPSLYMLLEKSPHLHTARSLTAEVLIRCYRECSGDLDAMAERLRVSRSTLRRRLGELSLP